jgi:hypothetical protein
MKNLAFIEQCEEVANDLRIEIIDTYDDGNGDDVFEDDGILHVVKGNTRVAFDVGCGYLKPSVQNQVSASILKDLGIPMTERAMA